MPWHNEPLGPEVADGRSERFAVTASRVLAYLFTLAAGGSILVSAAMLYGLPGINECTPAQLLVIAWDRIVRGPIWFIAAAITSVIALRVISRTRANK